LTTASTFRRYPTRARGVGANVAFLMNVLGCVPASLWVFAELPLPVIAAGIGAANLLTALLSLALPETAGSSLGDG